ncbi:hypothetical protein [Pseudomonas sp. BF-R-19]|uniref:hypothetical protein n=1 Tax=Pseudomonas sp. BF-R-19 TaxID=2832397 RepID=UPI001CC120DF|nr:hypothetical protein [Pseudomonas sp. BF-R-19]
MDDLIALHERRCLHFLMSEQEFRCLAPAHQRKILLLRCSYEDKFLQRLQAAGATAPTAMLKAFVQGLVVWLNTAAERQHALCAIDRAEAGVNRRNGLGALSVVLGP